MAKIEGKVIFLLGQGQSLVSLGGCGLNHWCHLNKPVMKIVNRARKIEILGYTIDESVWFGGGMLVKTK